VSSIVYVSGSTRSAVIGTPLLDGSLNGLSLKEGLLGKRKLRAELLWVAS
jgi:hypothetical protein